MILKVWSVHQQRQHSQMLVRQAGSQASPRSSESEFLVVGPRNLYFNAPALIIFIHVEKH